MHYPNVAEEGLRGKPKGRLLGDGPLFFREGGSWVILEDMNFAPHLTIAHNFSGEHEC